MGKYSRSRISLLALTLGLSCTAFAQGIQLGDFGAGQGTARRQLVESQTDSVQVRPGKPEWIELRFRVNPGIHINSHAPKDETLIPTVLSVSDAGPVKIVGREYPAGVPFRLEVGAGEVLSTYQGEFRILLQVVAGPGDQTLEGSLRYQACDTRSCYPAKNLPVRLIVTGR